MSEIKFVNRSNGAAFAVEWAHESGNRYQLVNPRGEAVLLFGAMPEGQDRWITQPVVGPERFGMGKPPKTFKEFMAVVRAYTEGL